MGDMSHEPSMEEILSSIKKIIAEDSGKLATAPRLRRAVTHDETVSSDPLAETSAIDVLELTEAVHEAEAEAKAPALQPQPELKPAMLITRPAAPLTSLVIERPVAERPATIATPQKPDDVMMTDATAAASRDALAQIGKARADAAPAEPGHGSVEAFLAEMLRPMLKDWLDANLPRVVEKMVAKEIARLRLE